MPQRDCWWCIPVAKYGVLLFTESGAVVITDYSPTHTPAFASGQGCIRNP